MASISCGTPSGQPGMWDASTNTCVELAEPGRYGSPGSGATHYGAPAYGGGNGGGYVDPACRRLSKLIRRFERKNKMIPWKIGQAALAAGCTIDPTHIGPEPGSVLGEYLGDAIPIEQRILATMSNLTKQYMTLAEWQQAMKTGRAISGEPTQPIPTKSPVPWDVVAGVAAVGIVAFLFLRRR